MPVVITERFGSRVPSKGKVRFLYQLTGSDDDIELRNALLANAPISYDAMPRTDWGFDEQAGPGIWFAWVQYSINPGTVNKREPGEESLQFDTTGGTMTVTQAIRHVASYTLYSRATDHNGAINVKKDGTVNGVEIGMGNFRWTETRIVPAAQFTAEYRRAVGGIAWHVNAGSFRGHIPGEVLFKGMTATQRITAEGPQDVECQFSFEYQPSKYNFRIGLITVPEKIGWQYLWVEYEESWDALAGRKTSKPSQVNIDEVYWTADFAVLGIGS
jgi:hypothetical protein